MSLSMMLTVARSLMYSPLASTPGMRAGLMGVNDSRTLSSYSRVISSFEANKRISALFVKRIGNNLSKSDAPANNCSQVVPCMVLWYLLTCSAICCGGDVSNDNKTTSKLCRSLHIELKHSVQPFILHHIICSLSKPMNCTKEQSGQSMQLLQAPN